MIRHEAVTKTLMEIISTIKLVACVGMTLLLFACGNDIVPEEPPVSQDPAQVLSSAAVSISSPSDLVSITDSTMVLLGIRTDVKVGTVLVSSIGEGALRKVVKVTAVGGNTVVSTEQASLAEAFDSLRLSTVLPFNKESIGDIVCDSPGVTIEWVESPSARFAGGETKLNDLKISFGNVGISGNANAVISGTSTYSVVPLIECEVNRAPGTLFPSLAHFSTGVAMGISGTMLLTTTGEGQIDGNVTWFDEKIGHPIPVGYLVFQPYLTIESSFYGRVQKSTTFSTTAALKSKAEIAYDRNNGWTDSKSVEPSLTSSISSSPGEFDLGWTFLSVTLSYKLYNLFGPAGEISSDLDYTGKSTEQNGNKGISVVGNKSVNVGLKIKAESHDIFKKLCGFKAEWEPASISWVLHDVEIYNKFFPDTKTRFNVNCSSSNTLGGTVEISPISTDGMYDSGTTVQVTGISKTGYEFTGWSGDISGTENPKTVVVDKKMNVVANFDDSGFTLATTSVNGTITKSPDKEKYKSGEEVTLTAIPLSGYNFSGWSGDLTGSANPEVISVNNNMKINAQFNLIFDGIYSSSILTSDGFLHEVSCTVAGTKITGFSNFYKADTPESGVFGTTISGVVNLQTGEISGDAVINNVTTVNTTFSGTIKINNNGLAEMNWRTAAPDYYNHIQVASCVRP